MRAPWLALLAIGMGLAACDAGPSAVMQDGKGQSVEATQPQKPEAAAKPDASASDLSAAAPPGYVAYTPPQMGKALPLPSGARAVITGTDYGDWPLWSQSRKYSADDNAHYQYAHHGTEIGATSYADFLAMVHGFVHNPPKGTQTLKRRNGDTLYYNARENVFAVMTKTGAPRILFRPRDGADYWEQQKQIEASGGWRGHNDGGND